MSKKRSYLYLVVLACAVFVAAAVATADLGAFAQNTNSSTTDDGTQNTNSSASGDISGEQTDLSGTYTGKIKMTGSHEMEGDGTITISGNSVTIEASGMTHTGRIHAVTTRGYTGVTMYFPDIKDTATDTNLVLMSRARKRGDRLWLTPVPGARNVIAFR